MSDFFKYLWQETPMKAFRGFPCGRATLVLLALLFFGVYAQAQTDPLPS
jgi:hypothetical protein